MEKTVEDRCPDCGRDLSALGIYRDYCHYIPGTQYICLPYVKIPLVEDMAQEFARRLEETLSRLPFLPFTEIF